MKISRLLILACGVAAVSFVYPGEASATSERLNLLPYYPVFSQTVIHFTPDSPLKHDSLGVKASERGRVMSTQVELPARLAEYKITARLNIQPIAKDELEVYDKWDRAGNIRLASKGMADIELIKFVTAYGGATEYEVDLSHLAPVLTGSCTIRAFIDTWVSPGWLVTLTLVYRHHSNDTPAVPSAHWSYGLLHEPSFDNSVEIGGGLNTHVKIPGDINRVLLYYYVSGHCTDGRDADEFVSKDNVISVDGVVVHRYKPWRDDCKDFRAINPYCKRWSDGSWSSDYSRSGWCPGDLVEPLILDLTDHLTPGSHNVNVQIEDVRPKDADGHYGYWRVSAHLVGYR